MGDFDKKGGDGLPWPQTMDAQVWVEAWRHYGGHAQDDDGMLGWFANAIMAGFDEGGRRASAAAAQAIDPFRDQMMFMVACGQSVQGANPKQALLYDELIREEHGEWKDAMRGEVEDLDAIIDQIVVLIGYALSQGWDVAGAWNEVMRSNFAKVGEDGVVKRRTDGKILKPEGWTPPNLLPYLRRA